MQFVHIYNIYKRVIVGILWSAAWTAFISLFRVYLWVIVWGIGIQILDWFRSDEKLELCYIDFGTHIIVLTRQACTYVVNSQRFYIYIFMHYICYKYFLGFEVPIITTQRHNLSIIMSRYSNACNCGLHRYSVIYMFLLLWKHCLQDKICSILKKSKKHYKIILI